MANNKVKKGFWGNIFGGNKGCDCGMEIVAEPKKKKGGCCDMKIIEEPEEKKGGCCDMKIVPLDDVED